MATNNKNFRVKNGLDVNGPIGVGSSPSYGSIGQVLTSQGTDSVPTWTTVSSGGLTATDYVVTGKLSSDQTIASNTNEVLISFVDDFDPQGWWNATSKQFTPNVAGYYNVALHVWWTAAGATTNQYNVQIRKNSNTSAIFQNQTVTGSGTSQGGSRLIYLNGTTDYIDFTAYNGDASTRSLQWGGAGQGTWFSAALMTAGKGDKGDTGDTGPAGTSPNAFTTVSANGTSVVADSSTDTLTITPGDGFSIAGNATSDTITFTPNVAGASANGIVTTGTQTFAGEKTFSNTITTSANIVANTGFVSADTFRLDTTYTGGSAVVGELSWDPDFETARLLLNGATLQIGQEHLIRVKNASGSVAIPDRTLVMFAGATGDTVTVSPADSSNIATNPSDRIVGITTEEIPADDFGFVTQFGFVNGVNTAAWTVGTLLYSDPATPGGFVTSRPAAPSWSMPVAAVTRQHANTGRIFVRALPGQELEEIDNVQITSVADNEVLAYNSANGTWINQTAEEAGVANLSGATFTGNVAGTNFAASGNVNALTVNATDVRSTSLYPTFIYGTSNRSIVRTTDSTYPIMITGNSPTYYPLVVRGYGTGGTYTQTQNLQGWSTFNGTTTTIVSYVDKDGNFVAPSFSGSGTGLSSLNTANLNSNTVVTLNATNITSTNVNATTINATTLIGNTNASTITTGTISNARTTASDANGASTIVARDASGNFAANTITASLAGTASYATVAGEVALSNVTGLSTALDAKANLSGATFTGDISVNGGDILTNQTTATLYNATATTVNIGGAAEVNIGNITHAGNTTINNDLRVFGSITFNNGASQLSATTIQVDDTLISLSDNNIADESDIGFYAGYNVSSIDYHTGLVRDASDKVWNLFSNVAQPTGTVNFANAIYDTLKLGNLTSVTSASNATIQLKPGYLSTAAIIEMGDTSNVSSTPGIIFHSGTDGTNIFDSSISAFGGTTTNGEGNLALSAALITLGNVTANNSTVNVAGNLRVFSNVNAATVNVTGQLISTVATGTAPLAVTSTTMVPNLTAQVATQVNTIANTTSATFYPTFVDANNGTTAVENIYTGAGLSFNPSTSILTTNSVNLSNSTNAATVSLAATGPNATMLINSTNRIYMTPTNTFELSAGSSINMSTPSSMTFGSPQVTIGSSGASNANIVLGTSFYGPPAITITTNTATQTTNLTGDVYYATATAGDNSTRLATTAYVDNAGLTLRYSNAVAGTKTIDLTGAPGLIYAVLVGAGGGGGAGAAAAAGGGGGAGTVVSGWVPALTTAVIGTAGAGGVASVGSNGAATTYSTLIAYGGTGGGYQATLPSASLYGAGAGGGGGVSTTTQTGGATSTFVYSIGGAGGNGQGASASPTAVTAGSNATSGGGGGGAYSATTAGANTCVAGAGGSGSVGGGGGGSAVPATNSDGSASGGAGGSSYAFSGGIANAIATTTNAAKFCSGSGGAGILAAGVNGTTSTSTAQIGAVGGAGGGGGGGGAGAANGGAGGAGALLLYW